MSKKKQGGKLTQRKRPNPKFLGVKAADGQLVKSGSIIVRQRGTKFGIGNNVKLGRDHTIFATANGIVKFVKKMGKKIVTVVEK